MGPAMFKIFGSIAKVEEQADGTIKVYGIASSPARDAVGESITAAAMKASLPDYQKFPALREMHQPSAAGRVLEAEVDDAGNTNIVAHVVDPIAVIKVKTGTYSGFSIGGQVLKRDPKDRTVIDSLKLVEISLVDSPCNPDAILSMWKADLMHEYKPEREVTIARAKALAKAAGTARFRDFLFEAHEELLSEHILKTQEADELLGGEEEVAAEEPPVAPVAPEAPVVAPEAPVVVEGADVAAEAEIEANAEVEGKEAAATVGPDDDQDHGQEGPLEDAIGKVDPAAVIAAAIESGRIAMGAAAAQPPQIGTLIAFEDIGKAAAALKSLKIEGETVTKSLYHVSRVAELLSSFASVQSCVAMEAAREGDNSPIPAQLADQIKAMGECLVAMAKEEVAELFADDEEDDGVTIVFAEDYFEYGAAITDLVKADSALMEAAAARLASAAPTAVAVEADPAEKAALTAEVERLSKALESAAPAVEELTKSFTDTVDGLKGQIADLEKRFGELDQTVIPPKTAGPAITSAVSKAQDSTGNAGALDVSMSDEQLEKAWSSMDEEARGKVMLKAALQRPQVIAQRT